jgi:hypothetical protein
MKRIGLCLLIVLVVGVSSTSAQSISGVVLNAERKPLTGVEVYGTRESCCPASVRWTVTRSDGKFTLKNPGPILHFRRIDLRPMSLRVVGNSAISAIMVPNESPMVIPMCEGSTAGRFGAFLQFTPSPDHPIRSGRDVDYKSYGFETDGGSLESWFGPTASNIDTFEERYVKSKVFSERAVLAPGLGVIGIDASGVYPNGQTWRWVGTNPDLAEDISSASSPRLEWHLSVATNGIGYNNASGNDQKIFDAVIDSACATHNPAYSASPKPLP